MDELAEDIKANGLISPVTVTPIVDTDKFRLVAGERRVRAHIMLAMPTIEAYVISADELKTKVCELAENIRRKDFEWAERVKLVKDIDEMKRAIYGSGTGGRGGSTEGWTQQDTANILGSTAMSVSRDIELAKIVEQNPDILKQVKDKPVTAARKVAKRLVHEKVLKVALANKQLDISCQLYNTPCEVGIKTIADSSVQLLITDPPFAKAVIQQVGSSGAMGYASGENVGDEDVLRSVYTKLMPELYRVLKPGAHLYVFLGMGWYTELFGMLTKQGFLMDEVPLIWYKGRVSMMAKDYHYIPSYEAILFGCKPPRSQILLKPCPNCIVDCPSINGLARIHPLQKPPELLDRFIENSSSPGDVVLDCFAGSGSVLEAARRLHRKSIGFEKYEGNFLIAKEWLGKEGDVK